MAPLDHKEPLDLQDHKVLLAHKGPLVMQGRQDLLEPLDLRAILGHKAHRD